MMFFNFGRFWPMTSQLEPLLEKEGVTLEDIFNEDNILMEIKNQGSQKFAKFVLKAPENYVKMINYITKFTEEPQDKVEKDKLIKNQFSSSEILGSENQKLINFLFTYQSDDDDDQNVVIDADIEKVRVTLLPLLLQFLESDFLNITSAGYFNKVLSVIIKKKGFALWEYLAVNQHIFSNLLKHLDISHIAEIAEKLIFLETNDEQKNENNFIEQRSRLLKRIFDLMVNKSYNEDILVNCSSLINEIVQKGLNSSLYAAKDIEQLVEQITKPAQLISLGIETGLSTCFQIVYNLVEYVSKHKGKDENKQEDEDQTLYDQSTDHFKCFYSICDQIQHYLSTPQFPTNDFLTTYGAVVKPLTVSKLHCVEIFYSLIKTKDPEIIKKFADNKITNTLLDILIEFQFNNQLQNVFEKIVTIIFESETYQLLQDAFVRDGLITEITNQHKFVKFGNFETIPGYRALFTKLSNYFKEKKSYSETLNQQLESKDWLMYEDEQLKEMNSVEQQFLCGINPKKKQEPEDSTSTDNDVQRILERFQQRNQNNEENNNQDDENQNDIQVEEDIQDNQQNQDEDDQQESEEPITQDDGHNEEKKEQFEDEEKKKKPTGKKDNLEIDGKINEVIKSPETSPKDVSQLIEIQELNSQNTSLGEQEKQSDSVVNKYWKTHEIPDDHHHHDEHHPHHDEHHEKHHKE